MAKIRKKHDVKFKAKVALEAIKGNKTFAQMTSKYGVHSSQIARWKKEALEGILSGLKNGPKSNYDEIEEYKKREEKLYQQIGQLTVELEWLKKKSDLFD